MNSPRVQKAIEETFEELKAMTPQDFERELELAESNPISSPVRTEEFPYLDTVWMLRNS